MRVFDICNNFKDVSDDWNIGKSNYWIYITEDELDSLQSMIMLDQESIKECVDIMQPSKISFFDGYIFIVFNVMQFDVDTVSSKELNIFLSKDYIITVQKETLNILEEFMKDIKDYKNCFLFKKCSEPSILLYYILDRIIIRNYDVISSLEAQADNIEISILKSPRREQIKDLIHLRRQVYKVRKYLNPLRYIGDSLVGNDNSIIDEGCIERFISLNNKIDKLMLVLESLVQDLALVREAYESEISNKTNDLMKVFTIIATIFLPLNLITSMYGMNVKHIPLTNHDYGYYYILGIMAFVCMYLVLFFKRKKWF